MKGINEFNKLKKSKEDAYLVTPFDTPNPIVTTVYPFTEEYMEIIPEEAKYGNYRIGCLNDGYFWVKYFGRSDDNNRGLRQRVSDHLSKGKSTNHKTKIYDESYYFSFSIAPNALEAFKRECRDFHTFIDLDDGNFVDNDIHPDRPKGHRCPICNE